MGIKKYKPEYILADKTYDTGLIRRYINKEIKEKDQNILYQFMVNIDN